MKFIIVGAGEVGLSIAKKLTENQHEVVIIEKDKSVISQLPSSLDLQAINGHGCAPDILSKAGIKTADYILAVANNDEVNISAALVAKLINPEAKRIVRIRNLNLVHHNIPRESLDEYFDLIINPQQAGADHLFDLFRIPGAQEVFEFAEGKLRLLGLEVEPGSHLEQKKISSLRETQSQYPFLLIAIIRANKLIVPRGSDRIHSGDLIYSISAPERTDLILELAGKQSIRPTNAMIWGASMLGRFLAHMIESTGTKVKLILSNPNLIPVVTDELHNTLVLQGHGTDQNLLIEENIQDVDSFIAVSPNEEENILASLLAKKLGAKTSMALINKMSYRPLISAIGIDIAVSSHQAAAWEIVRHIHSKAVISEFSLKQNEATFIELCADENLPILDTPLAKIKFPYGILLSALVREGKVIIPHGDDEIKKGDTIVFFTLRTALKKLQQILDLKLEIL